MVSSLFVQNRVFESEKLAEGPCLKRTTARGVRCLGIGDFRNMPEARFVQVFVKRRQESKIASIADSIFAM